MALASDYHDESRHLEHGFLTSLTRALSPGGVLIYVVPQPRLAVSARYLSSHYAGFQAFRFPDPAYGAFHQMVFFAVRKPKAVSAPAAQAELAAWNSADLASLPDVPAQPTMVVPSLPVGDVLFASLTFDPRQAAAEARRRGAWTQPELAEQLWPSDEQPVRPLMSPRRGHLALLIAAGMLKPASSSRAVSASWSKVGRPRNRCGPTATTKTSKYSARCFGRRSLSSIWQPASWRSSNTMTARPGSRPREPVRAAMRYLE